jgi:formylglycine-generating enzyme required for sulfatase activity
MTHILVILFFLTCSTQPENPPGTVKLTEDLYIDRSEVTNVDWREMLYWYNKNYGDTSQQYIQMLPDSNCWKYPGLSFDIYFRHPSYQHHPVVCISHEQALLYCKWRSDRVNEAIYRKKNKIKASENLDFTKMVIPVSVTYRLPSPEEWEKAASTTQPGEKGFMLPIPEPAREKKGNNQTLVHMAGNVSEMTSEKGVARGANYTQKIQEYNPKQNIPCDKAHNWLGFRCVCEVVK